MKTLGPLLCGISFSIGIVCLSSQTLAQNKPKLPSPLNASSSVSEIVNWLDKNSFSHARIGLESDGPNLDPMESMMFTISEGLVFSSGFKLVKVDGCRLTLRNDEVKVLSGWTNRTDSNEMSLANFVWGGKKGEKKLTPQSAVLFIPLDKMRYGKKPYQHTKNPEQAKLLGTWRTKFKEKGFLKRFVFQMEITAVEDPGLKGKMKAATLTFTFDDKEESQRFNAALRQAIGLCARK
jgi:hypothetical protein